MGKVEQDIGRGPKMRFGVRRTGREKGRGKLPSKKRRLWPPTQNETERPKIKKKQSKKTKKIEAIKEQKTANCPRQIPHQKMGTRGTGSRKIKKKKKKP